MTKYLLFMLLHFLIFSMYYVAINKVQEGLSVQWTEKWLNPFGHFIKRRCGWIPLLCLGLLGMWFHGFLSMICLPFCALLISGMLYFWGRKVENREQYSGQEAIRMVRAELLNDDSRNKLRRMLNSYASCLNDRYGDWCSYISDDGSEGHASLHDVRAWVEAFDDEGNPIDKLEREEGLDLIESFEFCDFPILGILPPCGEIQTVFNVNGDEYPFFMCFHADGRINIARLGAERIKEGTWDDVLEMLDRTLNNWVGDREVSNQFDNLLINKKIGRFFPRDKVRLRQDECAIIVDACDNARIMGVLDKDGMIKDALENNRLGGLSNVVIAFVKNTGTIDVRWEVEGVFSIPDTLYENVAIEVRGCDGLIRCAICDAECFYRFFGVKKQKFGKRELGEFLSSRFKEKIAFVIGQIAQECKEEVEVVCSRRDRIAERLALSFDAQFKDESGLSVESVSISSGLIVDNDCPGKRMIQRIKEKRVETLSAAKTYLDEKRVLGAAGVTKIEEEVIKNLSKSNARGASGVVAPLVSDYVNNEIAVVYCHKCGERCKKGSNFCSRCGTNLQET